LLALLAAGVSHVAFAADALPTETARYDYEWIHLRLVEAPDPPRYSGAIQLEEVTALTSRGINESRASILIKQDFLTNLIDCHLHLGSSGPGSSNHDIIQVGPFAQQAEGDIDALLNDPLLQPLGPGSFCSRPPEGLTVHCPYGGVPATSAEGHHQFTINDTFNDSPGKEKFTQRVQHGPIHCDVFLNGEFLAGAEGTLTRIKETRTSFAPAPVVFWRPDRWLRVEDLRR
jgi:hypothetical protein